ncbi:mechanosensitive ion channel family protein [Candidatus Nomurabacteria bacterium]|nr:mechanosensitive ion channel family protein [Candidatus Nomurabacteria bacterium]
MVNFLYFLQSHHWLSNSFYDYLLALIVLFSAIIILKIFQSIILARLYNFAQKTQTDFDDVLIAIFKNIKPPLYFLLSFYFAAQVLYLPSWLSVFIKAVLLLIVIYEIIKALERLFAYVVKKYLNKNSTSSENDEQEIERLASMAKTIQTIVRIILWTLGLILVLANLGINVNSLVASLGIGGLAVALAMQNILSDLFSSFSIYLDKPFQVGDFIKVGSDMGVVEKIGLKTTRLRTLLGEQLVISNKELTSVRVQNFKRMEKRRESFILGVVYQTEKEKLNLIPKIIKEIVASVEMTEFDRCHFSEFSASSLNFEIVYYINSPDYNTYMDLKQKINLAIVEKFNQANIEFAYPSQTIYLEK